MVNTRHGMVNTQDTVINPQSSLINSQNSLQKSKIDFTPLEPAEAEQAQKNINRGMQIVKEQEIELPSASFPKPKSNIDFQPIGAQGEKAEAKSPFGSVVKGLPEDYMDPFESAIRYVAQPVKAVAYGVAGLPGLFAEISKFGAFDFDEDEIETLKKRFPDRDIEKELNEAARQAIKYAPSISSIFQIGEEDLGIPLQAKTEGQKALEVFSLALAPEGKAAFYRPGMAKAVMATSAYEGMKKAGLHEDLASFLAIAGTHAGAQLFELPEKPIAAVKPSTGVPGEPPPPPPPEHPGAITEEPSRAEYDIGEEALNLLKKTRAVEKAKTARELIGPRPLPFKPTATQEARMGEAFIRPEEGHQVLKRLAGEKIEQGVRAKALTLEEPLSPTEAVGEQISRYTNPDKTDMGQQLVNTIFNRSEGKYRKVNQAYAHSRELNKSNYIDTANFYTNLEGLVNEAKTLPEYREDAQLVKMADDIKNRLIKDSTTDIHGNIRPLTFKKLSSQELIDLATDLRKYVEEAYAHSSKNVFYRIVDAAEEAILDGAKNDPEAYRSYANAKAQYKDWAKTYNNDVTKNYRDPNALNFEQLYQKATNPDTYNVIAPLLETGEGGNAPPLVAHLMPENVQRGINLSRQLKRDIVERELEPWLVKNGKANSEVGYSRRFIDKLDSMASYLNPAEKQAILKETRSIGKKFGGRKIEPKIPTVEEYFWAGKIPEQIASQLDTVSGMKQINARLQNFPDQHAQFQRIAHEMAIRRLTSGKVIGEERTIMNVLRDANNLRFMEECVGKKTVEEWLENAKNIKKYDAELEKYDETMQALLKKELRDKTEAEKAATAKAKEELEEKERVTRRRRIFGHIVASTLPGTSSLKHFIVESLIK